MIGTAESLTSVERLKSFFEAKSLALVGASDDSSWCKAFVANLHLVGFTGSVYMVNPHRQEAFNQKTYSSLLDLPGPVDMAFVALAPRNVEKVVLQAAEAGIQNLVVLAAGYSEHNEEGRALEKSLLETARANEVTILGPNGLGFINFRSSVAPCGFAMGQPGTSGSISVVLQSGRLAGAVLDYDRAYGSGVGLVVSMGNEAMVTTADVIDYLLEDPGTSVIAMFLEGIRSPERFRRQAQRALEVGKPLVAMKVGRSPEGQAAAAAHTGALAGDDAVTEAAFHQMGVIRVDSIEELMTVSAAASRGLFPKGRRVGVVTASGGVCDVVTDLAHQAGLDIRNWSDRTAGRIAEIIPEYASPQNPLDVTGAGQSGDLSGRHPLENALEIVVDDDTIDSVFYVGRGVATDCPEDAGDDRRMRSMAADVGQIVSQSQVPVFASTYTAISPGPFGSEVLEESGLFLLPGIDAAVRTLGKLTDWSVRRGSLRERDRSIRAGGGRAPVSGISKRGRMSEWDARLYLEALGVPFVPAVLINSGDELDLPFDFPVVTKVCAPGIPHKSNVGGVELGISSREELAASIERLLDIGRTHDSDGLQGVIVSPQRSVGFEVLVGVTEDSVFGKTLTLATGGVLVEVLQDASHRLLPVARDDVAEMLEELRAAPMLKGFRGQDPVDLPRLLDVILSIADAAYALGDDVTALEVNPLAVSATCIEALDVLILPKSIESHQYLVEAHHQEGH